jgi:N6-L-threonylcarbamoyladenine synthase
VATAKGLAYGLGVPLFGVSTTDAILWGMWADGRRGDVAFALDAMRREVYPVAALLTDAGVVRARADYVVAAGDEEIATDKGPLIPRGLIAAFMHDDLSVKTGRAADVLPIYTRLSDAEETARQREGMPTGAQLMAQGRMNPSGVDEDERAAGATYTRRLLARDVDALYRLERAAFGIENHPWSRDQFAEEFAADNRLWLGFSADGALVGYTGLAIAGDTADLLRLGVDPAYRRGGVGRRLLEAAQEQLRRRGVNRVLLEVRTDNEAAIALYRDCGFTHLATREKYFLLAGVSGDAYVMELRIDDAGEEGFGEERSAHPLILGIETSCDETAAAVLDGFKVRSNVVASQIQWHARFGGVVPEIASRKHIEAIVGVTDEALDAADVVLDDLTAIAVTVKPGLVGALVVGLAFAKGLSFATGLPLIGINHLEGHMVANRISEPRLKPPFVSLIVSGGNTSLVLCEEWGQYRTLGETLDDATGEAFDKVAKVLGLGYPGGPIISKLAARGNPDAIDFPRAMMHTKDYQFSLSGLKTAVITYVHQEREAGRELDLEDIAASFQQAIIDVQVHKALRAVAETGVRWFCLAGGVAANAALRDALSAAMIQRGIFVSVPPMELCGDNAAMIAAAALIHKDEEPLGLDAEASANASFT